MSVIKKLVDIAKNQIDIYKAAVKKYAPWVDTDGLSFKCNQLFDASSIHQHGSVLTVDSEGWITVIMDNSNGTSTSYMSVITDVSNLLKAGKQYLSVCEVKVNTLNYAEIIGSYEINNKSQFITNHGVSSGYTGVSIKTVTTREDFTDCVTMTRTVISADAGVSGKIVFRMSILEDTTITTDTFVYKPYISLESIRTKIKAKNLFDISKLTITNKEKPESSGNVSEIGDRYIVITTIDAYEGNGYTNTGHKLKEVCPDLVVGETYTLTANTQTKVQTCMYIGTSWYFGKSITITEEMLNAYVCFYGYSTSHGEKRGSCKISDITIVKGTKPETWSPYNVTTLYKLSTIKQNLDRVYEAAVRKYATIKSASGSGVISVTDSADYKPLDLKLYGKSEQKQYDGYNVLDIRNKTKTVNGITCTGNEDGVITVSGTPQTTEGNAYTFGFDVDISLLKIGTEYVTNIFCEITEGDSKKYHETFTMSEDVTHVRCYIQKKVSDYINGEIFYPVLCESKYDPNVFEPYVGGEPSPNINYPQPINHAGESGSIEGKFIGENLIDVNGIVGREWGTELDNSVKTTINGDELIVEVLRRSNNIIIPLLKKVRGSWTRYMEFTFSDGITENRKWYTMMDSSAYGGEKYSSGEGGGNYYIGGNTDYVNRIQIGCGDVWFEAGTTITLTRSYVNQTGNGFTPYIVPQPFTALTPNGFKGIPLGSTIPDELKSRPVHMKGVYWDNLTLQYYISDFKDYENGENVQLIFHGKPNKALVFEHAGNPDRRYGCNNWNYFVYQNLRSLTDNEGGRSLCSHAIRSSWGTGTDGTFSFSGNIIYYKDSTKTLDEINALFAEIGTDIEFTCVLTDPIITDLTEDELKQYEALRMNSPNTTILNDGGAEMELDYVVKPETV